MQERNSASASTQENGDRFKEFRRILKQLFVLVAVALLSYATDVHEVHAQTTVEVYNGQPASQEEAAFSVLIKVGNKTCSGIVASEQVILTALHCGERMSKELFEPRFYTIKLAGNPDHARVKVKNVVHIGNDIYGNDQLALMLEDPIQLDEYVRAIPLGEQDMLGTYPLFVIGHGGSEHGHISEHPIVGSQSYRRIYSSCGLDNMIATQSYEIEGSAVTYYGDSGGGLFVQIPEGDSVYNPGYYLVGITTMFCDDHYILGNGEPDPTNERGYHSVVGATKEEIEDIIKQAPDWQLPPSLYMPLISNFTANNTHYLPQLAAAQ